MKTRLFIRRVVTALPISLVLFTYNAGSGLASDDFIRQIADGRAWVFKGENGRNGRLTLNPDGSGKMKAGFMSMSTKWRPAPGGFCMEARMMGNRCVELGQSNNGFIAYQSGKVAFTLSR
ncbi:MAG: hypothetical protein AAF299_01295 [Pseudomonadota bacterium]